MLLSLLLLFSLWTETKPKRIKIDGKYVRNEATRRKRKTNKKKIEETHLITPYVPHSWISSCMAPVVSSTHVRAQTPATLFNILLLKNAFPMIFKVVHFCVVFSNQHSFCGVFAASTSSIVDFMALHKHSGIPSIFIFILDSLGDRFVVQTRETTTK